MTKSLKSQYLGNTEVIDRNGQKVEARVIQKNLSENYWKVSIENLIQNLGKMTPKSMKVIDYVLNHTNYSNNSFIGTNSTINEKCSDVGYTKIANTLSFLNDHEIITRRPGVIMWNPKILNHKKKYQVPDLIIRYRVLNHTYRTVKPSKDEDTKRTAKARKALRAKRKKQRAEAKAKRAKRHAIEQNKAREKQTSLFSKNTDYSAHLAKFGSKKNR